MKGQDWDFKGSVPDAEDVNASFLAAARFFEMASLSDGMNDGERDVHIFNSGFARGQNWTEYKLRDRELYRTLVVKQFVDLANTKVTCLRKSGVEICEMCCDFDKCELYKRFVESWMELQQIVPERG